MSIKSAPFYWAECDCCGAKADYGDYAAWQHEENARDYSEAGFEYVDDADLCPACWCWPEDAPDYDEATCTSDDPVRKHETHPSGSEEDHDRNDAQDWADRIGGSRPVSERGARIAGPIILSGETGTGTKYVQYWTETEKIAGREVAFCRAYMQDGDAYAPDLLRIAHGCPSEWIDRVLADFESFRIGGAIQPTHRVEWSFGTPTFHAVPRIGGRP